IDCFRNEKTEREVRWNAALALGEIGPAARDAVPALIAALKAKDDSDSWAAAAALGGIGPAAKAAVPALHKLVKERQCVASAKALGRIGPAARAAVPDLIRLSRQINPAYCREIEEAVRRIDPKAA